MMSQIVNPRSMLALLVLFALSACASDPYSEASNAYGIYALQDDELVRLDGNPNWEKQTWNQRSDLPPDVKLFIHEPRLAAARDVDTLKSAIALEETAHVRNEIDVVTGREAPVRGSPWRASGHQSFRIAVDFAPAEGRPAMIYVIPQQPLRPGLYTISYGSDGTAIAARFGVGWNSLDHKRYADLHCVDRYVGEGQTAYFGCDESEEALTDGLEIGELKPVRKSVDGVPVLTVRGTITNTSDAPRRIPTLRARMRDQQGVEQQWSFKIDRVYVLPAETMNFHTEIQWPMPSAERVNVSFEPETSTGS